MFLFITTIKKKKIKKQLLVADGGIIENKVLFSYVWLLGVICGYVWFLLFWCAFLWGVGFCFGRRFGFGRGGKGALRGASGGISDKRKAGNHKLPTILCN